ncbi:MAG: HAD-IIIA family hydrolase [Paludibacteraceae bacterium]|nr:HAD-IIIA family hydrolase [Paludibacteraceae bacterium]
MPKYTAIIFDLYGTLMNTLDDLTISTNHALSQMGFPTRTIDEVRQFLGNGVRKLIEMALPEKTTEDTIERTISCFLQHYTLHCKDHSRPYDGILELLSSLKKMGVKMAIVSNKPDVEVKKLNAEHFAEFIDVALGENEKSGIPRKPSPAMVYEAMAQLGSEPEKCLYVGDSDVDILTARNAGIDCLSVTWGFKTAEFLSQFGATKMIDAPSQMLKII